MFLKSVKIELSSQMTMIRRLRKKWNLTYTGSQVNRALEIWFVSSSRSVAIASQLDPSQFLGFG